MLALVGMVLVFHHPSNIVPACPNQQEDRTVVTNEPKEGETGFVDRIVCMLSAVHSRGCYWMIMDIRRRGDGPTNQPPCSCISGSHQKVRVPSCNMQVLATRT